MPAREERARAADERAQERGDSVAPRLPPRSVLSPGYVWVPPGMHPDHGEPCAFMPGQLLPDWAAVALVSQQTVPDDAGIYRLRKGTR